MLDSFAKYQEARIFFLFKKKIKSKNLFCVFPTSDEYNNI